MGNILTSWFQWKKPNSPDESPSHGKRRDNDDPFPPSRSLASPQTLSPRKSEDGPQPAKTESPTPPLPASFTEIPSSKKESIPEASQSANETEDKQPLEIKPQRPPSPSEEPTPGQESSSELPLDKQEELEIEAEGSRNERDPEVVDNAVVKIQAGIRGYLTRKALKENPPVVRTSNSPRRATEAGTDDAEVEETEPEAEEILVISEPQKPAESVVVPQEEPIKTEIISRVSTEIPEERASDLGNAGSQGPIILPVSKIEKELVDLLADAAAAGSAESVANQAPPKPTLPAPSKATTDHAPTATSISTSDEIEKKETPRVPAVQNEEEYEEEYTDEEYEDEEEEEEEAVPTQPAPVSVNHVGGQESPAVTPNRTAEAATREVRPQWVTSSVYDTVQGNQEEEEYEEEESEEEEEEEEENGTATPPARAVPQSTTPPARAVPQSTTPPDRAVPQSTTPPARVIPQSTTPPASSAPQPTTPPGRLAAVQQSQQASTEPIPAPSPIKDAKE